MAVETALAEELACFQYSNDSFLAVSRDDDDFYAAFLNVKNGISSLSLGEDDLIFSILRDRFSCPDNGEKLLRIKLSLLEASYSTWP